VRILVFLLTAFIMGDQALMDEVTAEIKAVRVKLEEVEAEIKQAQAEHNNAEVAALRKEKEQLRKEKEQLRTKEEQLRTKELLLLQRQPGARCYVWRRFAEHLIVCPRSELCSSCAATACGCSREQRAGADH
jgi:DNA repair exonuclease SbcCD ATPase subunit